MGKFPQLLIECLYICFPYSQTLDCVIVETFNRLQWNSWSLKINDVFMILIKWSFHGTQMRILHYPWKLPWWENKMCKDMSAVSKALKNYGCSLVNLHISLIMKGSACNVWKENLQKWFFFHDWWSRQCNYSKLWNLKPQKAYKTYDHMQHSFQTYDSMKQFSKEMPKIKWEKTLLVPCTTHSSQQK